MYILLLIVANFGVVVNAFSLGSTKRAKWVLTIHMKPYAFLTQYSEANLNHQWRYKSFPNSTIGFLYGFNYENGKDNENKKPVQGRWIRIIL